MIESLLLAELRTLRDVADLDATEAAELFGALRTASVPLGDRSRLRKVARGEVLGQADVVFEAGNVPDVEKLASRLDKPTAGQPKMHQERRRMEQHRRMQSGGGFSIEIAAIIFTGVIGMIGYVVQARSAQKASNAQAELDREAAEREKAEAKAGKQLKRVQLQMAEWVRPLNIESKFLWQGWMAIAKELNLRGYLDLYCFGHTPQPATPYIDLYVVKNPAMWAAMGQAPYAEMTPEDLALLAGDPALRSRYCELAVTVLLPSLRRLSLVFATKYHHYESTSPARRDTLFPGVKRDWAALVGTLVVLYQQFYVYAAQFESLAARWEEERFDLLQPDLPSVHFILTRLSAEQTKDVATREVELIGVSSGSRTVAGSVNYADGPGPTLKWLSGLGVSHSKSVV
jgi:hypothetical protein